MLAAAHRKAHNATRLGGDVAGTLSEVDRTSRDPHPMAYQRPTDDFRGTEPARQTDDDGLSDRHDSELGGSTSTVRDSRPGVTVALAFLGLFAILLVAAVLLGVLG
jgi:hypothetical protein